MRKSKQEMLNMKAQLEHIGVRLETLSRIGFNDATIETLGEEFIQTLVDLDSQQNCNRYVWEGLPDNLTSWLIENMLYNKGSLCGYISGGQLYVLPYAQQDGINIYGLPNAIQPITYNGAIAGDERKTVGKKLLVNNFGDINQDAKACILYDRVPTYSTNSSPLSRALLNKRLIDYQADVLGRIKNNLRNIDKKVVFYVDSESQAKQMKFDLREAYGTHDPFVVLVKGSVEKGKDGQQDLQGDISNQIQSLFETYQSINSIRCEVSGISNAGAFEKKERKITGELNGNEVQTDLILDGGLKMRKLWLEQMKRIYPDYSDMLNKITVKINETEVPQGTMNNVPYRTEENGGDNE